MIKWIIILLILIAGVLSLNTVFGSGFFDMMEITPLSEDTNVNIDEFNFTIPEGHGESE